MSGFTRTRTSRRATLLALTALLAVFALASAVAACAPQGGSSATIGAPPGIGANGIPAFKHVFLVVMENKGYSDIIGSKDAPYINQLAGTYGLASQFFGVTHPSLPNYLALVSGSTQGMTDDCSNCSFHAPNLADQLDAKNKSWRVYEEDLPGQCFNRSEGSARDAAGNALYVRKHNPWMYFDSIAKDEKRCSNIVPLSQLDADLKNNHLPDFAYIGPNQAHNMHDGTTTDGDNWLASFIPKILDSPAWADNGALFLIWDEGKGDDASGIPGSTPGGGRTVAIIASSRGKQAFVSDTPYNLYSVLRTIQDAWQLGTLGQSGGPDTRPMSEFFSNPPGS